MAKKLTQQQVGAHFDVDKGTVSAWETGRGLPDALMLRRLAKLYDVSSDALLWEDSLSPDAMKFAAQFDALSEKQRRHFKVMWLAYFEDVKSDEEVEEAMPITTTGARRWERSFERAKRGLAPEREPSQKLHHRKAK
jgi:transcriptional regulator with XRE-family HTH domain